MIVNFQLGSFVMSGEPVGLSWDTLRSGVKRVESQQFSVVGVGQTTFRTRPATGRGHAYACCVRMADISRLETEPAAETPRPKGVVGECPRGIPA